MAQGIEDSYINRTFSKDTSINCKDTSLYTYKGISPESYEELRIILKVELKREVSYSEAKKYGDWLVLFFKHISK